MTAPATAEGDPVVALEVPADVAYVGVVRSLAAGLAARLPFTVDEIDDLRIAVDEAFALLLPHAAESSTVRVGVTLGDDVQVRVDIAGTGTLDRAGFGWTLLEALAHVADVRDAGSSLGITLQKSPEEATGATTGATTASTPAAAASS